MKILLINSNRFKQPWPVMPTGLLSVAASLEKAGHDVRVLDLCFAKNPDREIHAAVNDFKPEAVGVSIRNIDNGAGYNTLFLLDEIKNDVIAPLKNKFPGPIVIGGPAVGINGPEMLEFFDLEYAIRGDGEAGMLEFVRRLEDKSSQEGLSGLIIRKDGKIIQDLPPFLVRDIDALPFPKPQKYLNLKMYRRFDSPLQLQTKRGCALKCAYCVYNYIEGCSYRLRSPESIADEIGKLVKETGITHIEFTDSVFNIPLDHAKNVLRAILDRRDISPLSPLSRGRGQACPPNVGRGPRPRRLRLRTLGLNPGAVDEELVDLMKRAGFGDVDLGAESGCDITLKSLGKNYTKDDVLRAGRLLREKKISIQWYLLLGAPDETRETIKETFQTVVNAASNWDLINIGIGIRLYNGSPLAQAMMSGYSERERVTNDNFLHPVGLNNLEKIDLNTIKTLTKAASFKYPNFFMYDEDETTPAVMIIFGTMLLWLFAPRQPIWKMFIALRKLETFTGIRKIKEWLWCGLKSKPLCAC